MTQIYVPIQEFVDDGYLQEVNRLLLHPLGMALEVASVTPRTDEVRRVEAGIQTLLDRGANAMEIAGAVIDDLRPAETPFLRGVWDHRDDPAGIYFDDGVISPTKAILIEGRLEKAFEKRIKRLGYGIQPIVPTA